MAPYPYTFDLRKRIKGYMSKNYRNTAKPPPPKGPLKDGIEKHWLMLYEQCWP